MTVSPQFNDELGHQTLLKHGKALMRKSWLKWMLWSVPIAYLFYGALAPLGLYLWWGGGLPFNFMWEYYWAPQTIFIFVCWIVALILFSVNISSISEPSLGKITKISFACALLTAFFGNMLYNMLQLGSFSGISPATIFIEWFAWAFIFSPAGWILFLVPVIVCRIMSRLRTPSHRRQ